MDYASESLKMHYELKGKIEVKSRASVNSKEAFKPCLHPRCSSTLPRNPEGCQQKL